MPTSNFYEDLEKELENYIHQVESIEELLIHSLRQRQIFAEEQKLDEEKQTEIINVCNKKIQAIKSFSERAKRSIKSEYGYSTTMRETAQSEIFKFSDKKEFLPPPLELKKVLINKMAKYKTPIPNREGNLIPTQVMQVYDENNKPIEGQGVGDKLFQKKLHELSEQGKNPEILTYQDRGQTIKQIITPEKNEMVVYKGIIFYKSSATSGSEETNRLNTWVPSLGLDNNSSGGIGRSKPKFKITKLDKLYDKKFNNVDERLLKYQDYLGEDLMYRLHSLELMVMSAEIGGGFWDTKNGKNLISKLQEDRIRFIPGTVKINEEPSITFDIPFEVKPEDNEYMKDKTDECNVFFKDQGGFVHNGLDGNYSEKVSVISQNRSAVQKSFFTHDEQTIYHLPTHWKKFNNILENLEPKMALLHK